MELKNEKTGLNFFFIFSSHVPHSETNKNNKNKKSETVKMVKFKYFLLPWENLKVNQGGRETFYSL